MGFFSSLLGSKKEDLDESFVNACLKTPDLVLRKLAEDEYDKTWKSAKQIGLTDDRCIEAVNINTLATLYEAEAAFFKIPYDTIAEFSKWESCPFNKLPHNIAKTVLIEYIVWRQYPDKADLKAIMQAIESFVLHLKQTGANELLDGFRNDPFFARLSWRKLLS